MKLLRVDIEKSGLLTTIQDTGRPGHQGIGVPIGGPMDRSAARRANWLVKNPLDTPVLECNLIGPHLRFHDHALVAITGANFNPQLNDLPMELNAGIGVEAGSRIALGTAYDGARCYLSIQGKWEIQKWLGSAAAALTEADRFTPDSLLKKGNVLEVMVSDAAESGRTLSWTDEDPAAPIRVLAGPEMDYFSSARVADFLNVSHRISASSNRMGYRLEQTPPLYTSREMVSVGVCPGTIQIPSAGSAIVLMADAQTSGGYPRFGCVIAADLDRLGQKRPGDFIRFELVDRATAIDLLKARRALEETIFGEHDFEE
ncbi:MAG: biotin-dependent carboxyltransferase family protein [Saprospiraceae bacterium]|nr:biotin-dependent carboxyltransferase family protein [Saprospiraceae bacterium]